MVHRGLTVSLALLALAACTAPKGEPPQSAGAPHGQHGAGDARPVAYTGLGSYSHKITTTSPPAQAWFDQGLRLVYAFNHNEAQKSFVECTRLDPACAMCYWGIAITEGSNYNDPTDAEREARALAAVRQAQAHAVVVSQPAERALIQALAKRHSADPAAKRPDLALAYADAMREVDRQYPEDLEAGTFLAEAVGDLGQWNLLE